MITIRAPEKLIADGYKLFIDTNIFMHTEAHEESNLKHLIKRTYQDIVTYKNPIIITSKVLEELNKHSATALTTFTEQGKDASAIERAKNAVVFIADAQDKGLFRTDLGDQSNPYADDTFIAVFCAFRNTYDMCLITNDITLLLKIRELDYRASKTLLAGTITADGELRIEGDEELLHRGQKKLSKLILSGRTHKKTQQEKIEIDRALTSISKHSGISLEGLSPVSFSTNKNNAQTVGKIISRPAFNIATTIAAHDTIILVNVIPAEGDLVTVNKPDGSSETVTLKKLLGTGGEGSAYLGDCDEVVKIYDKKHITEHRVQKIRLLMDRGLSYEGICFPTGSVHNKNGQFVGYIMPKAEGKEFSKHLFNPKRFRKEYPDWKKIDLIDICISVLDKITFLHSNGIILGDINPKNLLITEDKKVFIIDADSWQVERYPCPVGTSMYTAPEIQGKHYPDFLRTMGNENYAVVTLLFQIMITGQFPYARIGFDGDIPKSINSGLFAFQWKENSNKDQPKGNWKYMWSHLNPRIKEMFWNTFHKNGLTYEQTKRPSVKQWLVAFSTYRDEILSDFDPMSNDVYPTRYRMYRYDTPVYKCNNCGAERCGIWNDDEQCYHCPPLCGDCWKAQSNNAICKRCGKPTPKSDLMHGTCSECSAKKDMLDMSKKCAVCGTPFLTYSHIWWHQDKGKPIPTSHKNGDPNCRPTVVPSASTSGTIHGTSWTRKPSPNLGVAKYSQNNSSVVSKSVSSNTTLNIPKKSKGEAVTIIFAIIVFIVMIIGIVHDQELQKPEHKLGVSSSELMTVSGTYLYAGWNDDSDLDGWNYKMYSPDYSYNNVTLTLYITESDSEDAEILAKPTRTVSISAGIVRDVHFDLPETLDPEKTYWGSIEIYVD